MKVVCYCIEIGKIFGQDFDNAFEHVFELIRRDLWAYFYVKNKFYCKHCGGLMAM